jgi:integrase
MPLLANPDIITRLRAHNTGIRYEGEIINTLLWMKSSGLAENTIETASHKLNQIARNADLMNPLEVKTYIANTTVCNATKQKLADIYNYFAKTHGITWERPNYKYERKIPLIPTTENINKVISASSKKYATIFRILEETGIEGRELTTTNRNHIEVEQGIINVQGCKGHNSRSIKLKPETADMLRVYLHTYTTENPFPDSITMGEQWRKIRNRLANKLNEPQLKAIPLRNLRHHYATMLYDKTKDIILVMQKLGHKKINTTMFYTQLVTVNEEEEYTCKTAINIKEATDLLEHGFTYIMEIDGTKLFKKRK